MKYILTLLIICLPSPSFAQDRKSVREHYDDLMKASGKWDYISSSSIVLGVVLGAGAIYAYNRSVYYRDLMKKDGKDLDAHEKREFERWDNLANTGGFAAGACFGFAIFGASVEAVYQDKAHAFALDMGVKF
jgi:hypothetical protein